MVAACGQEHPAAPQRAAQTAETAPDPSPKSIASPETALATHRLRTLAATALRSGHLLTPAGDSALEYYLALHELRPNDHAVASALADLQPYRSEEHTSELQSLMRLSSAVFCLKKKK